MAPTAKKAKYDSAVDDVISIVTNKQEFFLNRIIINLGIPIHKFSHTCKCVSV